MASLTTTTPPRRPHCPPPPRRPPQRRPPPSRPPPPPPSLRTSPATTRPGASGSAGFRPVPRVHHAPVLRVAHDDSSTYALALALMKHPNPVVVGLAMEAVAETAGPECIVPGRQAALRLMGVKVWPLNIEMKFLEPFEPDPFRRPKLDITSFFATILMCLFSALNKTTMNRIVRI